MNKFSEKRENLIFIFAMAVLLLLQIAVLFYFGGKKAGFHEDELYTYYSSNKTAGLFINDRQWVERDQIRNDFVVLEGEQFRYDVVKQMQSWDVHPPVYYYIFHTACSLFPGVFSKWLGIGVNLIAYACSFVLLAYAVYSAVTLRQMGEEARKMGKILAFLSCLGWGFGGAVISGVLFIRMYQWLTLFILLCLSLHLRAVKKFVSSFQTADWRSTAGKAYGMEGDKNGFGVLHFLLPLSITVFLGFLTQYYYLIFHFFLGIGFCFFLLKNKKIKEIIFYVLFCGAGFLGAVLYYPASLSHIFRGYRGTEAVSEFSNISNTWERLRFFVGLFDDYMMNGTLSWWLLGICLLAVTAGYIKKKKRNSGRINEAVWLILFACAGYFFTVAKTALILGETSNRYQLPIYGLLVFLILYGAWTLLSLDSRIAAVLFGLVLFLMDGLAIRGGRVFFLYEEEKEVMEFVKSHKDDTVAVLYNEASGDHIWWLSDELMEYEKVYLASLGNQEPIEDEVIAESESILVYLADYENKEECLERLLSGSGSWDSGRVIAEKGLWTLYELKKAHRPT